MRWESLQLNVDPDGQLGLHDQAGFTPGGARPAPAAPALFERGAVTRTFDTPGFRDMTFFEIQARSIINRVPESSHMAFRWTINPYRGCSHACAYCAAGETPVLMGDGRTKPLADVRVGDVIYGTVRDGRYRRYTRTQVLAHWQTVKPGYRITLEDGTRLIASGDHRFLTNRGWKYVTGAEQGELPRPHLTLQNEMLGTGGFAEPAKDTADYRRGYLCGMIRGGGPDPEEPQARDRTRCYLADSGTDLQRLIQWPTAPSHGWRKGFLAGIFDAAGSCSQGVLRISNPDQEIIGWTVSSLQAFGFAVVIEPFARAHGLCNVRFRGGLKERLRFFHTTDPAITRKRDIDGVAIKSDAKLGVAAIEPLGLDIPMYDITTGTGDFIANGVVSHNCFARNTHTYLDLDSGLDFNSKIVVKVNAPDLIRKELAAPKWQGEHIAMGTNVDCYQRAEGRYKLMPGILGALRDAGNPFSILTKGTLILRDLDLLVQSAEVTDVGLNVSVGFVDKELWRSLEPGTPAPDRRLGVCATVTEHGLRCGVLMGPIVPFLSDSPAQLEATVKQIAESGATHVTPIVLHLRTGAREWFYRWLNDHHPDLVGRYRALYRSGAYAPKAYQQQITEQVRELARKHGVGRVTPGQARAITPRPRPAAARPVAEPEDVQLTLL
ncbi:MAG TPA: intein-containing Rv2578c family radical SAM protein [Streptosporangiaceae bacterium]|jgi:DNA repair photolyase